MLNKNRLAEAEEVFKKSLEIREKIFGPEHSRAGQTLKHMITLYEMQEKWTEALEVGLKAEVILGKIFGQESVNMATLYMRLGMLYDNPELRLGVKFNVSDAQSGRDVEKAKFYLKRALNLRKQHLGETSSETKEVEECLFEIEHPELKAEIEEKRLNEMEKEKSKRRKKQFKREAIVKAEKRTDNGRESDHRNEHQSRRTRQKSSTKS